MTVEIDGREPDGSQLDWRMEDLLSCRRWALRRQPFRHIVANGVFRDDIYEAIVESFQERVDNGQGMHYTEQHDFTGGPLTTDITGPLRIFLSPTFHDIFVRAFGLETNGVASAGLHRHQPGSRNGFPHNDISPEQLSAVLAAEELAPGVRGREQMDGAGKSVRAAAILFYLNNGPWKPGDGGSTGLYRHWSDPIHEPVVVAPPRDNTLLAFECSPFSYHSFISNKRRRDSVIVFLYRSLDSYLLQWGIDGTAQYADM